MPITLLNNFKRVTVLFLKGANDSLYKEKNRIVFLQFVLNF